MKSKGPSIVPSQRNTMKNIGSSIDPSQRNIMKSKGPSIDPSQRNVLKSKGPSIDPSQRNILKRYRSLWNSKQDFFPRSIIAIYSCSLFSVSKVTMCQS